MHIQCVSHSICNSGQYFTLSFSTYSSHAAVVPTRLLIEHPPAPALGTYTRWRWSILFWYTGWWWSILYWYTGWRLSILYSGDVGVEHRSLETVCVDMWLSFPYAYSMRFAFDFSFRPTFHIVLFYLLFPFSCSAYQTFYRASPGSSTGYVYTMAVEHSLLVYRMAVEHSLLVYRMAVKHSLLRRRRSGTL